MGIKSLEKTFLPGFHVLGMDDSEIPAKLLLEYASDVPSVCPVCGGKLYAHDIREINFTDTPMLGKAIKLNVKFQRRRCQKCGNTWVPPFEGVNSTHQMTNRAYAAIANAGLKHSFEDIAEEYGINPKTAKNVFVHYIEDKEKELRFATPAFLGLDEIKIKKIGEVTVVTDLEHRTLYDMMEGRNQPSLTKYFERMPNAENVRWVCTDMYRPFEKSIRLSLPNAKWVVDHFHVVAYANRALDAVRIEVQKKLKKSDRVATKKGLAYTLRTRESSLSADEAAKIRYCRADERLRPLATAFDLKEDFFNIYDLNMASRENAEIAFEEWEQSIPDDAMFDAFRELAGTVHNFYEQIFNLWDCPIHITNGFTECTNRIIRENSVKGRGSSFQVLRGRTLYRKTNLERINTHGLVLGPSIPSKGPVFHFEETKDLIETVASIFENTFSSFDYDPHIGLKPGVDYDPETGEIFDDLVEDNLENEPDLP